MCDLRRVSVKEKVEGFKIVARKPKGKRYYSIAIGFKYPLDGHIPKVRKQCKISVTFFDDIISKVSSGYRKDMIGRTAIYLHYSDAQAAYHHLLRKGVRRGYRLKVVRCIVSKDIMEGYYCLNQVDSTVVAGRHIHFMEEMMGTYRNPRLNKM